MCIDGHFIKVKKKKKKRLEVKSKKLISWAFPLNVLPILGRKFFGGIWVKTPGPTIYLFFLPTQPNILQKSFLPIFSPKFSIYPISPPNKHTLTLSMVGCWWLLDIKINRLKSSFVLTSFGLSMPKIFNLNNTFR